MEHAHNKKDVRRPETRTANTSTVRQVKIKLMNTCNRSSLWQLLTEDLQTKISDVLELESNSEDDSDSDSVSYIAPVDITERVSNDTYHCT